MPCERKLLLIASARVAQVIKWFSIMNRDRSHEDYRFYGGLSIPATILVHYLSDSIV